MKQRLTRGELLKAIGVILLELFETMFAIKITLDAPNAIGTASVFCVIMITFIFNFESSSNLFVQKHLKLYHFLFSLSTVISFIALLYILFKVSPLG